jgi:hypothetical protein
VKGVQVAPAAVAVSARTVDALLGVTWPTLAKWAGEHGIRERRLGRRKIYLLRDIVEALDCAAAAEWTEEDTTAALAAAKDGR